MPSEHDADRAERVDGELEPRAVEAGPPPLHLGAQQVEGHDVGEEAGEHERRVHREHAGQHDDVRAGREDVAPQVHEVGHDVGRVRQEQHEGDDARPPGEPVAGPRPAEQHDRERRRHDREGEVPRDPAVVVAGDLGQPAERALQHRHPHRPTLPSHRLRWTAGPPLRSPREVRAHRGAGTSRIRARRGPWAASAAGTSSRSWAGTVTSPAPRGGVDLLVLATPDRAIADGRRARSSRGPTPSSRTSSGSLGLDVLGAPRAPGVGPPADGAARSRGRGPAAGGRRLVRRRR